MYIKSQSYDKEIGEYLDVFGDIIAEFKGSEVLITGAAGLIGNYIADLLMNAGGVSVTAVDRDGMRMEERFACYRREERFTPVVCDINDFSAVQGIFESKKIDYVIHAASNTSPIDYAQKPVDTVCTNVLGTHNLLECCKKYGVKRFMFCSSVEAYGAGDESVDEFDETYSGYVDCNTVRAGYPSAKRAAEAMCNAYQSQYGVDFVTVRIGRIYGATVIRDDTKAPTQFIMNAVKNEDIVLKSPGTQEYSFGYVGDCVSAMLFVLAKGESGNAYNVADPNSRVFLKDFAKAAADSVGKSVIFRLSESLGSSGYSKVTKAVLNTDKLLSLGWRPLHGYEDGVKRTVEYLAVNN